MNNIEIKNLLLISIQRALLGMIYPSIRAIAVGFEGLQKLQVVYYLDREPTEADYENISEVTGEVCADISFSEVEEFCVHSKEPFTKLNGLSNWVYLRKE